MVHRSRRAEVSSWQWKLKLMSVFFQKNPPKNSRVFVLFCVNDHLVSQLNTNFDHDGVSVAKTGHCSSYSIILFPSINVFQHVSSSCDKIRERNICTLVGVSRNELKPYWEWAMNINEHITFFLPLFHKHPPGTNLCVSVFFSPSTVLSCFPQGLLMISRLSVLFSSRRPPLTPLIHLPNTSSPSESSLTSALRFVYWSDCALILLLSSFLLSVSDPP